MTKEEKHYIYVINKSLLSEKDIAEIESRIERDKSFDEYISSIRKIMSDSENVDIYGINIDEVFKRLFGQRGYSYELSSMFENNDEENMKLAAKNAGDVKDEFKYFNTYAAADNFILIRVLKNTFSSIYRFYVITDDMELVKNTVLKINDSGDAFITDDNGVASIYSEHVHKKINIKAMIPVDIFTIDTDNLNSSYISERKNSGTQISVLLKDNELSINFERGYLDNKTCYLKYGNDEGKTILPEIIDGRIINIEAVKNKNQLIRLVIVNNI